VVLSPGDRILIVTDGVTEAHAPDGVLFGEPAVRAFLGALSASEPHPLEQLLAQVRGFEDGRPASDDIAALLLTFNVGDSA
jgi:serine phosphatase RsbU (regulator of sigma subunit)